MANRKHYNTGTLLESDNAQVVFRTSSAEGISLLDITQDHTYSGEQKDEG